jgi:hypothetical protein
MCDDAILHEAQQLHKASDPLDALADELLSSQKPFIMGIRHQRWLGISMPSVDAIRRMRSAKVRQPSPVFYAAKQ